MQWETAAGGGNEHFYKHVVGKALTWENARVAAEALTICSGADKGYLVTLTTAKENAFVFHTLNLAEIIGLGPWLGGYQPGDLPRTVPTGRSVALGSQLPATGRRPSQIYSNHLLLVGRDT
jgi:hypothetical protein